MTYAAIDALGSDQPFIGRVTAADLEQALVFKDDARPQFVAAANSVLRGEQPVNSALIRFTAGAPGLADKATTDSGVDSSLVTDGDILSAVQGNFPTVAALFYDDTGAPL